MNLRRVGNTRFGLLFRPRTIHHTRFGALARCGMPLLAAAFALTVAGFVVSASQGAPQNATGAATPSAQSARNPIPAENRRAGTTAWRLTKPGTDAAGEIKGYASAVSLNKGGRITFYVSVNPRQAYTIDVYRMGWYKGRGGRLMRHVGPLQGARQGACPADSTTGLIECNWRPSFTLTTRKSWTSGVYLAKLTNARRYENYIVFVVRDDRRSAALLYQQPVTTYQAYNNYPDDGKTGKSLYDFNSYGGATITGGKNASKVSFDRPYARVGDGAGQFLQRDVNFVRWMERSGFDVTYSSNVETHQNGSGLLRYRGFLSVGHDEYWSKPMYDAAEAARDAGVNLAFFGANAIYWQIRFEPSTRGVSNRVIVCYRDARLDPVADPALKTVVWRQPPVSRPEQKLIGVQYTAALANSQSHVPYRPINTSSWVYAGTGFKEGDQVAGLVGYEGDRAFSTFPMPDAVTGTYTLLSRSPLTTTAGSADYANSSVYQARSGAWVFAAGSIDWSWGLDKYGNHGVADARIQRTTANILRRFSRRSSVPAER
jgi:hypothetical protein